MPTLAELQERRATHLDVMQSVVKMESPRPEHTRRYDSAKLEVENIDKQIERVREHQSLMARSARPVGAQGLQDDQSVYWARPKTDLYEKDSSLAVGGMIRTIAASKGDNTLAIEKATASYGERHPVTVGLIQAKAVATTTGTAGGFVVPPDFVDALIPLLYARAVVRKAGAIAMPMPSGTMTLPKMTAGAMAYWIGEGQPISESAPLFGQIAATAHKLAAFVPVTNDMMRYATPAFDTAVRNDVVTQMALAEDAAFIRAGGSQFMPRGMKAYATALGTQLVSSASAFSYATVAQELGAMVNYLEMANVPLISVAWLMSPRTKNYLLSLQNANGYYIYRDEMTQSKTLLGYPFYTTTQIPVTLQVGSTMGCSEIYLGDFSEALILESRQMEFSISTEASYVDAGGVLRNAFQNDLSVVCAIMAEDFQLRHDEAVVLNQGVTWQPAATEP